MTNKIVLELGGIYKLKDNKLYRDDGLLIHIRKRKKSAKGKKAEQFLAIHKPTYQYISSLYPKEVVTGEANGKWSITEIGFWKFDWQQEQYILKIKGDKAFIKPAGGSKNG